MTQRDDGLCGLVCLVLFKFWFLFGLLGLTWTDFNREFKFSQYSGRWVEELEIMIANYRDSADSDSNATVRDSIACIHGSSPRRGAS